VEILPVTALPDFSLEGRTALVTGAARGLGHAIALALANAGADVALGLRDKRSGDTLSAEIEKLGRRALPLQMDIAKIGRSPPPRSRRSAISGRSISWSTMSASDRRVLSRTSARRSSTKRLPST
jgi:NAD(P)-dependent dehydrogenase (short-subunit alcohol dehydrogenase family)